jgi:hypothetical protein
MRRIYKAYDLLVNKRIRIKRKGMPSLTIKLGKKRYIAAKKKGSGGNLSLKLRRERNSKRTRRTSGKIKLRIKPRKKNHKNRKSRKQTE